MVYFFNMRVGLVLMFVCSMLWLEAQIPLISLKNKQVMLLANVSKTGKLFVVIENEKNADDAALIKALKNHWKVGEIKYLSSLEFNEKIKSNNFDKSNLYLFNNFSTRYVAPNPKLYATLYDGFYLTNDPGELYKSKSRSKGPPHLYFSPNALYDLKKAPINGYYSLMIKNFNHDVMYCQNAENFKSKKRKKRKNGVYFFKEDSIKGKTLLLVKEQTLRQEKKKKNEKSKNNASAANSERQTDKFTNSKPPIVVFPEDIEYAVTTADNDILLYTGGTLYSAYDGSVYCTVQGNSSGTNIVAVKMLSYAISLATVVWFIKTTRN